MNIFVLDAGANRAANNLCLKHVCKMIVESIQMLCCAFPEGAEGLPYRRSHYNHPCTVWSRETFGNWSWLYTHAQSLMNRYRAVYGKTHKCEAALSWMSHNQRLLPLSFRQRTEITEFVMAMPEKYKITGEAVESYRQYYIHEKAEFAKWESIERIPLWWPNRTYSFVRRV